jgi:hypothetical protein
MTNKVYLQTTADLVKTAKSGEKVFMEYRDREEEFEQADRYESHDWDFTLRVYSRIVPEGTIKFFKKINI